MSGSRSSFTPEFASIPEIDEAFLKLWPHRWDFIRAAHTQPDLSPNWRTESKFPLSDRLILDGSELVGVRFGADTRYMMLDIDAGSIYHPKRDRFATGKIFAALERLGLTDHIAITSSYRGGVHLYFPLGESIQTWQIAAVVDHCLKKAGFYVAPGILEIFPNTRGFEDDPDRQAAYLAHRLPLQPGSYLLDDDWNIKRGDQAAFCKHWEFCEARNELNRPLFRRLLSESANRRHKLSYQAKKFLHDLTNDIEPGWSGSGQTNALLGRIALREYVFGHVERRCQPLEGERLTAAIVESAVQLPGYRDHCRHQAEIWQKAEQWARSVEQSRYYHYRTDRPADRPGGDQAATVPTWNRWQQDRARERITFALADMLNRGNLPALTRERFERLTADYGLSGQTLYNHRELWHPDHLWKTPPSPPCSAESLGQGAQGGHMPQNNLKLIDTIGCNTASEADQGAFWLHAFEPIGCNTPSDKGYSPSDGYEPGSPPLP